MEEPVVIMGSSRSQGETRRAIDIAFANKLDCFDLRTHTIAPYDYDYANKNDDFLGIIDQLLPRRAIIFATPVYWYAMSAQLKTFFDRFSDLVRVEKPKGRALAGKDIWLLTTCTDATLPQGFEVPFHNTAKYLDMNYRGAAYLYTHHDTQLRQETEAQVEKFGGAVLKEYGIDRYS